MQCCTILNVSMGVNFKGFTDANHLVQFKLFKRRKRCHPKEFHLYFIRVHLKTTCHGRISFKNELTASVKSLKKEKIYAILLTLENYGTKKNIPRQLLGIINNSS